MSLTQPSPQPGFVDRLVARSGWVVAGIVALLTVVLPLGAFALWTEDAPEVRVLETERKLSALVVDDDVRILIIDTRNRERARDALGRLYRPWEARPQILIAPATDDAAIGLWTVLEDTDPRQVLVAGSPGALPLWGEIEAECLRRGIPIQFIDDLTTVTTPRLTVSIFGREPESEDARAVVIRRGDANVVLAFDAGRLPAQGQVVITAGRGDEVPADLLITASDEPRETPRREIIVASLRRVRVVLARDEVQVFGGARRGFDGSPTGSSIEEGVRE